MASNTIFASIQRVWTSYHVTKKQQPLLRAGCSFRAETAGRTVSVDGEDRKTLNGALQNEKSDVAHKEHNGIEELVHEVGIDTSSVLSYSDDRWRNGTWDLNLFVKDGKIDWDSVIVAEASRRKFLEMNPEPTTNQAPVIFRSSIVPWWAWLKRFHLPEAELLNGRAAMVGFFMAYLVDGLSGLGMVDQMSNLLCKTCLFAVVAGIICFRWTEDFRNLRTLVNEATFYDNQWKASWEDQNSNNKFNKQDQKTK